MRLTHFAIALCCALALLTAGQVQAQTGAPRIGVQLWSVKDEIQRDFEGTLRRLSALGAEGVEFAGEFGRFGKDAAGLRAFMDGEKLRCAGAHLDFAALSAERFAATTTFYRTAGCTTLVIAMDQRAATAAGAAGVARDLAALAAQLAPLGMRIGYHNHAEELRGAEGATPWDVIARGTPADVVLQQDIGWTTYAGKDPAALIRRYPGRTLSAHFKAKFLQGTSGTPLIGRDKTDWAGVAQAARSSGGTLWFIVEQEEYPSGVGQLDAVEASLAGLRAALGK